MLNFPSSVLTENQRADLRDAVRFTHEAIRQESAEEPLLEKRDVQTRRARPYGLSMVTSLLWSESVFEPDDLGFVFAALVRRDGLMGACGFMTRWAKAVEGAGRGPRGRAAACELVTRWVRAIERAVRGSRGR